MAINVERRRTVGRRRAATAATVPETLAIGDDDQQVFDCPSCRRPLAVGVRRCPGCRTRLVRGIQLSRASLFAGFGGAVGFAIGVAFVITVTALAPARSGAATPGGPVGGGAVASAQASSEPTSNTSANHTPAPTLTPVPVSATARSSLGQSGVVNVRLATSAAELRSALRAQPFDVSAVASALRSLASDSSYGVQVAPRIGQWEAAGPFSIDLTALYTGVRDAAHEGLASSVTNTTAYRAAATRMLTILARLGPLDAQARELALQVGIELPELPA